MSSFSLLGRVLVGMWGFPLLVATIIGLTNGVSAIGDGVIAGALLLLSLWATFKSLTMGVRIDSRGLRYRGYFRTIEAPLDCVGRFDFPDDRDNVVDVFSDWVSNPVVYLRGRERAFPLAACMSFTWIRDSKVDRLNDLLERTRG